MTERPLPSVAPPSALSARLAYWGYDVLGGLAALLAVPAYPWLRRQGLVDGVGERLGRLPA
ncbi:MAG: hypothetical protein ACRERC_18700, partial [Candidatus Binatia bacterium]